MTQTIKKLTAEQEAQLPSYVDKWLNMSLKDYSDAEVTDVMHRMYEAMGEDKPVVLFFDSPLACEVIGNGFKELPQLYSQLNSQLRSQLDSQLRSQLYSQLNSQLRSQLDSQLRSQLRSQLDSQLHSQLDSQLHSQLNSQLRSQLDSQLHSQLNSQLNSHLGYCNIWWQVWAAYYDYAAMVGAKFGQKALRLFNDFNARVCYSVPLKGVCIVSRKPTTIQWKGQRLHAECEKAVQFRDGWGWYAYEGQRLPEKYGALPVSQWQPAWIDEADNADVRTVLLKGIGYDRWISETGGKVLDEWVVNQPVREFVHDGGHDEDSTPTGEWVTIGNNALPYSLIERNDPSIGRMVFLKMKNPSVPGVFHVEPVAPHSWIKTCEDALRWRILGDKARDKSISIDFAFIK